MEKSKDERLAQVEERLTALITAFEEGRIALTMAEVEQMREELQKISSTVGSLWHQLNILRASENELD